MELKDRVKGFIHLGKVIESYVNEKKTLSGISDPGPRQPGTLEQAVATSEFENGWFTRSSIMTALASISSMLRENKLESWLRPQLQLPDVPVTPLTVAVIMAGNIPAVGFHDFLCVLLSGNWFLGKLSSGDRHLLPAFAGILEEENPEWKERIRFTESRIRSFDAVIATGSNNSSGYFDYYFSKYPHIIRRNRNGIAVLTGDETREEITGLVSDIVLYFGLGCRNVSKLYVPRGYDFTLLRECLSGDTGLINHHKYANNYHYFQAIYQLSQVPFMDCGNMILKEDSSVSSPVSILHYQYYPDWGILVDELKGISDSVQCIVCTKEAPYRWCKPGMSQTPELWDYADGVDTMKFLWETGSGWK